MNLQVDDEAFLTDGSDDDSSCCVIGALFHQTTSPMVPEHTTNSLCTNSVIMDTGSSSSIFRDEQLLENFTRTKKTLKLLTNGGEIKSNMMGGLKV